MFRVKPDLVLRALRAGQAAGEGRRAGWLSVGIEESSAVLMLAFMFYIK